MAPTVQEIKARIGASRLFLEGQVGKGTHKAVSQVQANALSSMLASANLSDVEKADLTTLICDVKWASPDEATTVVSVLLQTGAKAGPLPEAKRRRGLQDFTAVHGYLTQEQWDQLGSDIPGTSKLHLLMQAVQRLGLRLPTEHTSKWLTCLWMHCSHTAGSILGMPAEQKVTYLKHVKSSFDGLRRSLVDPPCWVDKLPCEPVEYAKCFPALFATVFQGQSNPVIAPIDLAQVIALSQSFGCRGGSTRVVPLVAVGSVSTGPSREKHLQSSPTRDSSTSSLERVANMFMQQMQSMSAQQNRMLELMLGTGSGASGRPLRALSSVQDMPFLEDRPRQGTVLLQSPRPALPAPLTLEELESPSPAKPFEAGPAVAAAAGDGGDPFETLLDALTERSKDKATKAKAKAKAASTATVEPVPLAAATVAPMKVAKAKGAKAAKDKGPVEPLSVAEVKSKAKAAGKARCLALPPPPPPAVVVPKPPCSAAAAVAKARARAIVEAMTPEERAAAKEAAAASMPLGCGKCRYSFKGCGQCKSESFSGTRWNALLE